MNLFAAFWRSTIGLKIVMAVTGVILFGFVVGHLLGNLQIFLPDGQQKLDAYAKFLKETPALLWGTRGVLLAAVLLHIAVTVRLTILNRRARPVPYQHKRWRAASLASRTMIWTGPILAAFVVFHLLHFTTGHAHATYPKFDAHTVHRNVVTGFTQQPLAAAFYIVAMLALAFHLWHGAWSMFQSVGINHPTYNPILRRFAMAGAVILATGYILIPLAVLMGLVT